MENNVRASDQTTPQQKLTRFGFLEASQNLGDPQSLPTCLGKVEKQFLDEIRSKRGEYQSRIGSLKKENDSSSEEISSLEEEIAKKKTRINELKRELKQLSANPKIYDQESDFNALGFYIGAILLIFLTLYLFLFYSSATYSSLFKNLGAEIAQSSNDASEIKNVFRSIFDPKAFSEARKDGIYGVVFIFLAPFLFLSTGFALYAVPRRRAYSPRTKSLVKAAIIFIVFLADAGIAYKIDSEIYEAKHLTGIVDQPWQASLAFYDINFYLVIIAGFAAYIVWGLLLDFVADEYERSQPYRAARKKREAEIESLEEEIKEAEEKIKSLKSLIKANKMEIEKIERLLDIREISIVDLQATLDTFFTGWTSWLNTLDGDEESLMAKEKTKKAAEALAKFKSDLPKRYSLSRSVDVKTK